MDRVSTGVSALDHILGGGIPKGSTILLIGRPGTGKTILAHQMMFQNAENDNKVLYLTTLAEPQIKIMKFQQEFSFYDTEKVQKNAIYKDLGGELRKLGSTQAQAMKLIDTFLKEYQPTMIFIDTIKTFADLIPNPMELRAFMLDLSVTLTTWGCTTILLGEYSEQDVGDRPEGAIADGIIYLSGTEEASQQKRYLRVLKMRGTKHFSGQAVFKISDNGIRVFPRLDPKVIAQDYSQHSGKVSTGVLKLDELMEGGIPRASTTLVTGPSGTGKTMLALSFALESIKSGAKTVYVSFEENSTQIIHNFLQIGQDIQPYIDKGLLRLVYVSPVELDVDENVYRLQELVRRIGACRLIVDSISSFEIGMNDKVKYTDYIWALTDYFKSNGITVLLTNEMHGTDNFSAMTKHGISFVADNLILLSFKEDDIKLRRYLRVLKMRGSRHSTELTEIMINKNGISLV